MPTLGAFARKQHINANIGISGSCRWTTSNPSFSRVALRRGLCQTLNEMREIEPAVGTGMERPKGISSTSPVSDLLGVGTRRKDLHVVPATGQFVAQGHDVADDSTLVGEIVGGYQRDLQSERSPRVSGFPVP